MKRELKRPMLLIAFGVGLYALLMKFDAVLGLLGSVVSILLPVVLGLVIAFILSVPTNGFYKVLRRLCKGKEAKWMGPVSVVLTLLAIVLVLVIVITAAIPALRESIRSVGELIRSRWPEWLALAQEHWPQWADQLSALPARLEELDWGQMFRQITSGASSLLSSAVDVASATVSGVSTGAFAVVIAIYALLDRKRLVRQSRTLCRAWLKESRAEAVIHVCRLTRDTFSKFLSGQCAEAMILGTLIFIVFSLLRLPYAGLIAMLTGVCAFVPYVGALVACVVGTCLTLLVNPMQALLCLAAYLVVQFVENQFIYPHVVGSSVGLSPLWTLIAALVGGNLFGLFGMVFFVPLTAVLHALIREATRKRMEQTTQEKPV